ncbi:MAG TPA: hypothetical protein VMG55_20910 [Stellaceae bacterium]|nr:hypothetical protein [Stellaceae bacterium]
MKQETQQTSAPRRPEWSYTVQAPRTLSVLWILDRISILGVPLAGLGLLAAANGLGLISVH